MSSNPLVSVIIPTRDREKKLEACLSSVLRQSCGDIEIIVIDNASSDGTAAMIGRCFSQVVYISNKVNAGAAMAKNQGIRTARGKYVWFLDSDSRADNERCLEVMVSCLEAHGDIGSIGGELQAAPVNGMVSLVKSVLMNGRTETGYFPPEQVVMRDCDYCPTCNCFMRRKDVLALGGFDPAYFYLCEDNELGYRIRQAGMRNVCDHRTAVVHDLDPDCQRNYFLKLRNPMRLVIKNFPAWQVIVLPVSFFYLKTLGSVIEGVRCKRRSVQKYLPPQGAGKIRFIFFVVQVFMAAVGAYLWNILFLPQTLAERFKKRNHITHD